MMYYTDYQIMSYMWIVFVLNIFSCFVRSFGSIADVKMADWLILHSYILLFMPKCDDFNELEMNSSDDVHRFCIAKI